MPNAISVIHPLGSVDSRSLRSHIPEINHRLSQATSLKWRPPNKVGVTLIERGEYEIAMNTPKSSLAAMDIGRVAQDLAAILEDGSRRLMQAQTTEARFLGSGQYGYVQIAYVLTQPKLETNRTATTARINELAGVEVTWKEFLPHVSIATVDVDSADDSLLEEFTGIMPATLTLMGAKVV